MGSDRSHRGIGEAVELELAQQQDIRRGVVGDAVLLVLILLLLGGVASVYFSLQSWYNPYYCGKRVYDWAETAIWAPDPVARREATQALVEAFQGMNVGEPRTQLVLRFCYVRKNERGEYDLPKEVVPFLLEALHARDVLARRSRCPTRSCN